MQPVLRPARMCDAKKIHGLLMECSAEGLLLPRSLSNLYGQIRDFRILETSGGEFIGCAALAVIWENLAEVRSLAIAKPWRGKPPVRWYVPARVHSPANDRVALICALLSKCPGLLFYIFSDSVVKSDRQAGKGRCPVRVREGYVFRSY